MGLRTKFREWHKRYHPEWYEPIETVHVIGGRKLKKDLLAYGRDPEFEGLMAILEACPPTDEASSALALVLSYDPPEMYAETLRKLITFMGKL